MFKLRFLFPIVALIAISDTLPHTDEQLTQELEQAKQEQIKLARRIAKLEQQAVALDAEQTSRETSGRNIKIIVGVIAVIKGKTENKVRNLTSKGVLQLKESTTKSSMLRIQDHISGVRRRVTLVCTALMNHAIIHDNSKYSEQELNAHISMADEMDGIKYGTDTYYAIKQKYESLSAEHFANNRHHPEHHPNGIDDMTLVDVIEMLCDWLTGSENTGTPVERSLEINEKRYHVSPQLMKLLKNTIRDFDLERG